MLPVTCRIIDPRQLIRVGVCIRARATAMRASHCNCAEVHYVWRLYAHDECVRPQVTLQRERSLTREPPTTHRPLSSAHTHTMPKRVCGGSLTCARFMSHGGVIFNQATTSQVERARVPVDEHCRSKATLPLYLPCRRI